jgi:hypothetical protein
MRTTLQQQRGFTPADVATMTPQRAGEILRTGTTAGDVAACAAQLLGKHGDGRGGGGEAAALSAAAQELVVLQRALSASWCCIPSSW